MTRSPSESNSNDRPSNQSRGSSKSFRPLLPTSTSQGRSSTSISSLSTSPSVPPASAADVIARKRRPATAAACGACRKRKSKCDGARPSCSVCKDRETHCIYATNAAETHAQALKRRFGELQDQKSAYESIYEALQLRDEAEAIEICRRIRCGTDAESVLRHIGYGDLLVQMSLVPEADYRYEFPYVRDMPSSLQHPDNPYLDSQVYEMTSPAANSSPSDSQPEPSAAAAAAAAAEGMSPYLKPYHAAVVVDSWIDSAKPSQWTSVSSDDGLMRKLLHAYFLHEYGWFTFFHKDLFLRDLVAGRDRFCSDLLVNALLAYSCHCYRGLQDRAEYWNPKTLGYLFLAEAKRLWEIDLEQERLPTESEEGWQLRPLKAIQTALIFNVIYTLNGADKIGYRYTTRAIAMAQDIKLFAKRPRFVSDEVAHARSFTAWGLFSWQSLNSYHYLCPPALEHPPEIELPDTAENPHWYGEVWVKYPLDQVIYPTHHALLYKARTDFWSIVNGFSVSFFSNLASRSEFPMAEAFRLYSRLKAWFKSLPEPLTARRIVTPHQLKLHMHYHLVMINVLGPLGKTDFTQRNRGLVPYDLVPHDPDPAEFHPRNALSQSKVLFETLIRLYYLRHGFELLDFFLVHFLGALMHMTRRAIQNSEDRLTDRSLRSTLFLCAKGIHEQGLSHFAARAILSVQMRNLSPDDLGLLGEFVGANSKLDLTAILEHPVVSDWPTYLESLDEAREALRLGALCRESAPS